MQGQMREEGKTVSIVQLCRWFGVARSTFYYRRPVAPAARVPIVETALESALRAIIDAEPAVGLRMITARIRRAAATRVNRKKIHRIIKLNQWQCQRRPQGHRPRAQGWVSRATRPNERWAIDTTHLFCGRDGWCHLTAIIDCYDRTIVGWRLSRSGIAGVAAAALEEALRSRRIDRTSPALVLRSDNGLVFGAKAFVRVARRYGLTQEYLTPYNAAAERHDRALLPDVEAGMRVAPALREPGPRLPGRGGVA
ncbi:MAG: transposase family protein [bacterium]|nr:transposase family protein [bacterium]